MALRSRLTRLTLAVSFAFADVALGGAAAHGEAADLCRYGWLPVPAIPPAVAPQAVGNHTLALFYAVPTDVPYNPAVLARIKVAAADIQAWYQCATGGKTWEFAYPETVQVYHALHDRLYYKNNGDWWGSLLGEMGSAGLPIWSSGTVCGIWAHGAGWWAGAAQFCGVDCGTALLGVEIFPEFNNPAYSGGSCPGGTGVVAWPCTPEGAFAHELGHTLGLQHPADVPATSAVASHSIMQTHWDYPNYAPPAESPWGFLSLERQTLLANPFMKWGVAAKQIHPGCDVVNLPATGTAPVAAFTRDPGQPVDTFHGINTSTGAAYAYWMFGDATSSNATDGLHKYPSSGAFTVTLRSTAANAMVDTAAAPFTVPVLDVPLASGGVLALAPASPNPFASATTFAFTLTSPATVEFSVYEINGRRMRTLLSGARDAGPSSVVWDGRDAAGRRLRPGAYFARLRADGRSFTRLVVLRP